ncbi:MAG: carboxypeptidase regulatory-like domain-containing protein, partial [Vicinamibacterales bacterium]
MTSPAVVIAGAGMFIAVSLAVTSARQTPPAAVAIDKDDLGGVVSGPKGPEAGVWVIAETTDLPTRFAKIAVTDDRGRYLVPDLPAAKYS